LSRTTALVRPTVTFTVAIIAILVAFRLLDEVIARLGTVPPKAYQGAMFLDDLPDGWRQLASRHPSWLVAAGIAIVAIGAVFTHRRLGGLARSRAVALFAGWKELEDGAAVRWLVVTITGVVTWTLTLYPRNLYVDQLHLADRIILFVFWIAIIWRPVFVFCFAIVAAAVAGQFFVPLGFNIWAEMGVLMRFPLLFGAFWIVRSFTRERRSDAFIFVWCCLVATTYWTSGFGKLRIDWLTYPHVPLLLLAAHANGWLAGVDTSLIERAARVIDRFVLPLMVGTLVVECGSVLLLWRRWSLVGFLVLAAIFHTGAFAMTGICFWRWILADACLLAFLFRRSRLARLSLFTPGRFTLSVVVILASPLWVHSENLTWFDTPLTYSLRFEGIDQHGNMYNLPAGAFRPYSEAIVLGAFAAISPYPRLTSPMGITRNRSLAEALVAARTPEELFALEATVGTVRQDPVELAAFDDFFGRYATNLRCRSKRDPLLVRIAAAPRHLWTFPLDATLPCDVSLVLVRVTELTSFFDGKQTRVIRSRILREVPVVHM
jgi:hypothetical protein